MKKKWNNNGSILLVVVFAIALLTTLVTGMLQLNTEELMLMQNQVSAVETLAIANAGLNDAFVVLNEPARLSEGQKYRYRLARAIGSGKKIIFADEFCSGLDRITAAVVSHNIRKIAAREGITFVLAGSYDDLLCDLRPDVIVMKYLTGATEVIYRDQR